MSRVRLSAAKSLEHNRFTLRKFLEKSSLQNLCGAFTSNFTTFRRQRSRWSKELNSSRSLVSITRRSTRNWKSITDTWTRSSKKEKTTCLKMKSKLLTHSYKSSCLRQTPNIRTKLIFVWRWKPYHVELTNLIATECHFLTSQCNSCRLLRIRTQTRMNFSNFTTIGTRRDCGNWEQKQLQLKLKRRNF